MLELMLSCTRNHVRTYVFFHLPSSFGEFKQCTFFWTCWSPLWRCMGKNLWVLLGPTRCWCGLSSAWIGYDGAVSALRDATFGQGIGRNKEINASTQEGQVNKFPRIPERRVASVSGWEGPGQPMLRISSYPIKAFKCQCFSPLKKLQRWGWSWASMPEKLG